MTKGHKPTIGKLQTGKFREYKGCNNKHEAYMYVWCFHILPVK